ncbi:MAG: copper resistance CopC/CopD family protein [Gemmatimonadaceae bacterium]
MKISKGLAVVVCLGLLFIPQRAWAHAHLKRSDPSAGSSVAIAPQMIRFWFSERPELLMTSISLRDARGQGFTLGPAERQGADPLAIAVRVLRPLPPGRYTVTWRTAASDGHPSRGVFSFTVLSTAALPASSSTPINSASDTIRYSGTIDASSTVESLDDDTGASAGIANSLARTFSFLGLLLLIGVTTFRSLVLSRARGISAGVSSEMQRRAALLGVAASVVLILSAFATLFLESQMMSAMPGMQTMSMADMAMHTQWGIGLRLALGAAFVAMVALTLAARGFRGGWFIASIMAIALALSPALAGHAAASPRFTSLLVATDFLHVLGAASWLGTLFTLVVIGISSSLALDGTERWSSIASLVNSFSPLALLSAGVVVASGVAASWVHLERVSSLWQTAYGQVLLLKLLLVAITLTIGAYNFRRVQPQLVNETGSLRLRQSAAIELSVAFLVLIVTGFLTGISP